MLELMGSHFLLQYNLESRLFRRSSDLGQVTSDAVTKHQGTSLMSQGKRLTPLCCETGPQLSSCGVSGDDPRMSPGVPEEGARGQGPR